MFPVIRSGPLAFLMILSGLLLAACGGGSSSVAPSPPASTVSSAPVVDTTETITLAPTYTDLVQGTLYNTAYWPEWFGTGKPVDGVNCLLNSTWHKHLLISIYKDGVRRGFPDGIGRVHAGCYHAYEMHVHDVTGIIHMEADVPKNFTLGQWFSLWNQPLGTTNTAGLAGPVRFYIIDQEKITPFTGDPATIAMLPHREILIIAGTKMSVVPRYKWPLGI